MASTLKLTTTHLNLNLNQIPTSNNSSSSSNGTAAADNLLLASKLKRIKDNLNDCSSSNGVDVRPGQSSGCAGNNGSLYCNYDLNNQFKMDLAEHTRAASSNGSQLATAAAEAAAAARLVSLKNVVYTENVSRQSSIRSLINSSNGNNNTNSKPPAPASVGFKFKQQQYQFKASEFELLNDWDKFIGNELAAVNKRNPTAVVHTQQQQRPNTRLGFQNNGRVEYSDSVRTAESDRSVASSSSVVSGSGGGGKYCHSEDYEESVTTTTAGGGGGSCDSSTPTAGGDTTFGLYQLNAAAPAASVRYTNGNKRDDSTTKTTTSGLLHKYEYDFNKNFNVDESDSILSDFLTNLRFDDCTGTTTSQPTPLSAKKAGKFKGLLLCFFIKPSV
jgi:hypothetical protein